VGRFALLIAALAAVSLAIVGCGRPGHGARTDEDKASDVALLNAALAQELTTLDAYTRGRHLMRGDDLALEHRLRAHEQEYVDALTKAIRGLGGETEVGGGELDLSKIGSRADLLHLAYELESTAVDDYLADAPRLATDAPRTLVAVLAAGHAQHLVVLRQSLGTGLAASLPEGLESGELPPPEAPRPGGNSTPGAG
jgi:hypothetical protein